MLGEEPAESLMDGVGRQRFAKGAAIFFIRTSSGAINLERK
jgi:hypothetical protein